MLLEGRGTWVESVVSGHLAVVPCSDSILTCLNGSQQWKKLGSRDKTLQQAAVVRWGRTAESAVSMSINGGSD